MSRFLQPSAHVRARRRALQRGAEMDPAYRKKWARRHMAAASRRANRTRRKTRR
jgi:hypothetical protein